MDVYDVYTCNCGKGGAPKEQHASSCLIHTTIRTVSEDTALLQGSFELFFGRKNGMSEDFRDFVEKGIAKGKLTNPGK